MHSMLRVDYHKTFDPIQKTDVHIFSEHTLLCLLFLKVVRKLLISHRFYKSNSEDLFEYIHCSETVNLTFYHINVRTL